MDPILHARPPPHHWPGPPITGRAPPLLQSRTDVTILYLANIRKSPQTDTILCRNRGKKYGAGVAIVPCHITQEMDTMRWKVEGHQRGEYGSEVWVVDEGYRTEADAIAAARSTDWIDAIVIESSEEKPDLYWLTLSENQGQIVKISQPQVVGKPEGDEGPAAEHKVKLIYDTSDLTWVITHHGRTVMKGGGPAPTVYDAIRGRGTK
jgi:hypothetical protein